MDNPSRKQAWREAAGAAPSRPTANQPWQQGKAAIKDGAPWWRTRRTRIGLVAAALLAVTAATVVVALWLRPARPMHLVLIGAGYEDNLAVPNNVAGSHDLDALARWAGEGHRAQVTRLELGSDPAAITRALENSWWERAPETIVVFVSAHGVACRDGDGLAPCLVPQDDNLANRASLYRLDALLDALAALPERARKLLLVDGTRVSAHWPLGQLHNDFARALAARTARIEAIPNLVVLASSDADQLSWISPEWGQSVFGHYVLEGLRGAADQSADKGNDNGRVDSLELSRYVRAKVERWARHNRARLQTPVLLGGEQRAAEQELLAYEKYEPAAAAEPGDEKAAGSEDLTQAWQDCRELGRASPHPAVYTPHLWRRYLDTLLRAEELLRAGEPGAAAKLLQSAEGLKGRIIEGRALKGESQRLTLAMPAALGVRPTPREQETLDKLQAAWKEQAAKKDYDASAYEAALSPLLENAGADRGRRLAYVSGLILRNVLQDPGRLAYGRQFLEALDDGPASCPPTEAQFVMLLQRELEEANKAGGAPALRQRAGETPALRQPRRDLHTALELRLLAEEAALGLGKEKAGETLPACSEEVLPWIAARIAAADEKRRLGHDLLFASDAKSWTEADRLLGEARPLYEQAQEVALGVRRARAVSDRVLAELPAFTHWLAERGAEHEADLVQLWEKVHALRRLLEPTPAKEGAGQTGDLDKLAGEVADGFRKVEELLQQSARKDNATARTQDRWHEIEAVLSVPFLDADRRRVLLQASHDIARELSASADEGSEAKGVSPEANAEQARSAALRQGRLALAVLGKDDWPEYEAAAAAIRAPDVDAWHRSLDRAGEAIGTALNRLPETADELCEQAARADDLEAAGRTLRKAARCARQVEGATVGTRMKRDPVGDRRRLALHHLLVRQAHRTYLDYWAALKPGPETPPYYRRAGEIFLKDAEALLADSAAQEGGPRLQKVNSERALLRAPEAVVVQYARDSYSGDFKARGEPLDLTDEGGVAWSFRVQGPANVPGTPVTWVEVSPGLRLTGDEGQREVVSFGRPFVRRIAEGERAAGPPPAVLHHAVHGLFRGHRSVVATDVRLHPEATFIVSGPPVPKRGYVAVQAKRSLYEYYGTENTAIALVLDCSGSMNARRPGEELTRYQKATRALRTVLQGLPKGVTVSLRAFSAREFTQLKSKGGIELVWPAAPWDPEQLDRLMKKVEALTPERSTPLVRSLRMARDDFPARARWRSLVAITDGGDSNFYFRDTDADLKDPDTTTIDAFLRREFGRSDVQISVVGFEVNREEMNEFERRGHADFLRGLNDKDVRGQYYDAGDSDQLTEFLLRSLLHMYFRVDPDLAGTGDLPDRGENISRSDLGENPRWVAVRPGPYLVRVPSARLLQQRLEVRPGDALLLDLVRGERGPVFKRNLYAESDYITREHAWHKPAPRQAGWLLAALENRQLRGGESLHLMTTLEKEAKPGRPEVLLQQVRPRWSWFEVAAPERAGAAIPRLRVTPLPHYPAPAWGLDLPHWREGDVPTLKAWWTEQFLGSCGHLIRSTDFQTPFEAKMVNRPWPTDSSLGQVILEHVRLEKCSVVTRAGSLPQEVDNCLVVRLRYPPGQEPFFVGLPEWEQRGQEHHFYTEAGKYTGIFWPMAKDEVEEHVKRLDLFSVGELKKKALRVEKLSLGEPNPRFSRPSPVQTPGQAP
jgi:hypothetical protein